MPIPPDQPDSESTLGAISVSIPSSRRSLTRSVSDGSTHAMNTLLLTVQIPAVPMHVPVRTESRLRIVHDGCMQGGDNDGEGELQVVYGSTEERAGEVGLNIELVAVEDDGRRLRSRYGNSATYIFQREPDAIAAVAYDVRIAAFVEVHGF